jgi:hypothetical protein
LEYQKKGPIDHATTGRHGYEDKIVNKTETERRPLVDHQFLSGGVGTDRIVESLNESQMESHGVSIGIGKSSG